LDGGSSPKGEASTILDMTDLVDVADDSGEIRTTGKARIVRRGALGVDKLKLVLEEHLEV